MSTITPSDRHARRLPRSLLTLAALLLSPALARADDPPAPAPDLASSPDALDPLRERFREGMDKYKAGAFAEAIVIWEAIYRDLGSDKGYRVAFDLARAYDELGDPIRAADHYEAYLDRVHARRAASEVLEPNVARQEQAARERCDQIASIKARIRVTDAAQRPILARVDGNPPRVSAFVVYVEPGAHVVTFGSGADVDVHHVTVAKGELLDVTSREEPPAVAARPPAIAPPPPAVIRYETRVEHPFSPAILWVGAGVAALSFVLPVVTYANAWSIKHDYDSPSATPSDQQRLATDYQSARTNAYASVVVPALFTAAVGTLAIWYVLGAKETRIPLPAASVTARGASVGFTSRF